MIFLPAIDLLDGRCVRLEQGERGRRTEFPVSPAETAVRFEADGANGIHTVDLDGAFEGRGKNRKVIGEIASKVKIPVEVGGGIQSLDDMQYLFDLGVSRVVVGTKAVDDPGLVESALVKYGPAKIWVGIDAKAGEVAIRGWTRPTGIRAVDLGREMKALGISTVIYTDIAKDGMRQGPNLEETQKMAVETGLQVIASGGVTTLDDVRTLLPLESAGISGFIVGRAIYDGLLMVADVAALLR